ncbi:LOW QUALITY PROTEIN: endoplasmic reticulum junction formation protein lunapark-B-like [Gadus chalcogrammus]|uniref:LOW QUALITY PROTEIN: endoplasmic reticulum junction formation protein lunapark-B-like n=1 Tax=Gadus chalcogrammus TaxID=1042646 RepID=UPI0024C48FFC|nr:LOW QUALITY PROTEIN: endoplasmic reticulum junction formation protein lunapark-B-like [Gadus chalcogrammus]
MGAVISRWKTKPTTVEKLENLDKEIKDLEEFRTKNQRLLKLWVGRLILYSSVLYLLTCLVVYWLYLPEPWIQRIAMALPFFMVPVLVWFSRKLLVYLFSKRTERNSKHLSSPMIKLEDLKVSKRKILEEVMETETYKNAKLILERFDTEAKKKAEVESTPVRLQMTPRPGQEIRQRGVAMRPMPMVGPAGMVMMTPPLGERPPMAPGATPMAPGGPPERSALSTHVHQGAIHRTPCSPIPGEGMHPPGPPLARPVLPRERGTVDRVIEYLVGDGPQNRYALICQQCFSHNGMALKEEFEYIAFRCAYCYFMNPARKTRPQAPRLPEFSFERRLRAESPSPGPVPHSGSETEESATPSGDEREVGEEEESGRQVVDNSQSEESLQQKGEEEVEEQQRAEEPMEEAGSEEAPSEGQEAEVQASDLQDFF